MTGKVDRRRFLQYSGYGLVAASGAGLLNGCGDSYNTAENPEFWKVGNYPPVTEEVSETALKVEGSIPPELNGLYVRNGPNAWQGSTDHFFMGDGMLHGLRLENGQAKWYKNRYVQTPKLYQEPGILLKPPELAENQSNVSLIHHGGKLLSLGEAGWGYEIDPTDLSTVGVQNYNNQLQTAMTAHPKIDPDSGVMHFFGYSVFAPYVTYHQANPAGELIRSVPLDTAGPAMMHDFAMTENYVIFMEMPVTFSMFKAVTMDPFPFGWDDEAVCRMGVLPKSGSAADMQWFDVPTCFIFHTMNAYEHNGSIVLDAARYDSLWVKGSGDFNHPAYLSRYTLNLGTGTAAVDRIHEQAMEFPQINRQQWGRNYRYGYSLTTGMEDGHVAYDGATGLMKFDLQTGEGQHYKLPKGVAPAEPLFVAAQNATSEDDGYILSFIYEPATHTSDLWIFSASDFMAGAIAKVKLPVRVPVGFHGVWVAAEEFNTRT
ncbi:MAG: carotenoid oxygenase family protein [Halioglobus sp.]